MELAGDAPLAGLKVVEISMYAQGPLAGLVLANLGAEVVKIEPVGSQDPFRTYAGMYGIQLDQAGADWIFALMNRGKRCIALDVASEAGRPLFHRLIEQADVFVTNLRATAIDRMGADAETLLAVNPRLVYARGAGFGFAGDIANDPCQDTVGMAYSGFMDAVSTTEEPHYPPGALSDIATGTNLASAILAGLVKRSITGTGSVVGTSQVQTMMWLQTFGIGFAANLGQRMARFDLRKAASPLLSVYQTADGWISIGAVLDEQWRNVAHTMGLAHLLDDPRRHAHRRHQQQRRAGAPPHRPLPGGTHRALVAAVPHGRHLGVAGAPLRRAGHRRAHHRQRLRGAVPRRLGRHPGAVRRRRVQRHLFGGVGLGEDTDAVLGELGVTEEQLIELRVSRAIW
ncbi:MAG: CoA transferase [Acidimicrobiales bacterium]